MTTPAHQEVARRCRQLATTADGFAKIAEQFHEPITAADQIAERDFWHLVADHHEHCAEVRARTLIDG